MKTKLTAKTIFKALAGTFIVAPIMIVAFFIDRVLLIFLPFLKGPTIQEVFRNLNKFEPVGTRAAFVAVCYLVHLLLSWLF